MDKYFNINFRSNPNYNDNTLYVAIVVTRPYYASMKSSYKLNTKYVFCHTLNAAKEKARLFHGDGFHSIGIVRGTDFPAPAGNKLYLAKAQLVHPDMNWWRNDPGFLFRQREERDTVSRNIGFFGSYEEAEKAARKYEQVWVEEEKFKDPACYIKDQHEYADEFEIYE